MTLKKTIYLLLLICAPSWAYSNNDQQLIDYTDTGTQMLKTLKADDTLSSSVCKTQRKLSYYLYIDDFLKSFIEIPTSDVSGDSSTISSAYLAGRAPIYNMLDRKAGTCSASFLCMQNAEGIFTDISNYLSADNGLIISWFTPTTLANLELDSIVHSMVTECIVTASTKIGFNPYYGKKFNMIVSSDNEKIYFKLTRI